MESSLSQAWPDLSPLDRIPLQFTSWSNLTLKASGAHPPRVSHGQMPLTAPTPSCLSKGPSGSEPKRSDVYVPPVSPPAPSPAPALCTSGRPASSLMFSLTDCLRAYDNFSLLLLSQPHHPVSRQNTHTALLSPFIFPYKSASSGYTERKLV